MIEASLEAAGVRAIAISADTTDESRELCRKANLTFPLLSDRKAEVIRSYDLLVLDPFMLKKLAGHSDLNTTMRYVHLNDADVRAAMEKAEEARSSTRIGQSGETATETASSVGPSMYSTTRLFGPTSYSVQIWG